ncbi:MAG: MotA/TolQ/ExbB proton channel family protein [Planctomycetaceae bacterium]
MSDQTPAVSPVDRPQELDPLEFDQTPSWGDVVARSPWLWGSLLTMGFYATIPYLTFGQVEIQRYCCMHWVEYLEVWLFAVGAVVLVQKAFSLRKEYAALQSIKLGSLSLETKSAHEQIRKELGNVDPALLESVWGRRLKGIGRFVKERVSSSGLGEQLKFLSETAADALHDSHSLLQTIIWAIPIMGFLGTVLGITLAIANVTPDKLDTSLPEVTGGLAVAFDTTAIALLFSLALVFGSLFVKRNEDAILAMAEESALALCGPLLDGPATPDNAILHAEQESARLLIESTGGLIEQQTGLWQSSLDVLRERWSETVKAHEQILSESLVEGTDSVLADHAEQLQAIRHEFLNACQQVTQHLSTTIVKIEEDRRTHDETRQQQLEYWTTMLREDLSAAQRAQQRQLRDVLDEFASRLDTWQGSFQQLATAGEQQAQALSQHGEHLLRIVGQEENLARLQESLNENLDSLRETGKFEESLHSLNAAIHLLTARVHSRAA